MLINKQMEEEEDFENLECIKRTSSVEIEEEMEKEMIKVPLLGP